MTLLAVTFSVAMRVERMAARNFADGVRAQPGDLFEIDLPALGAPLRNILRTAPANFAPGGVRVL